MKLVKTLKTNEFIEMLRQNKNPEKIEGMENYMRNKFRFLGLQAVERRNLARPFLNEKVREAKARLDDASTSIVDWKMLFTLWEQPEREFQLIGIDYLKRIQSHLVLADFSNLRKLVLLKSWWDTVDLLSKNIGAIVEKEPSLIDEILKWSQEENIWIRRVSILHQLGLKDKTNTKLLRQVILNNLHDDEFFIQKAIGWSLREYAKTDEKWVRNFTQEFEEELSTLSYREAMKNLT